MKSTGLLSACLLQVSLLMAMPTAAAEPGGPNTRIQRYSMLVADLDRSLQIYRDVLGYKVVEISEVGSDSYIRKVFGIPESAKVRSALCDGADGSPRALYIAEVKGVALPPEQRPAMLTVLLRIENWERVLAGLKALGLPTVGPDQFEAQGGRITELSFTDPDGHLIVLYQRDQLKP